VLMMLCAQRRTASCVRASSWQRARGCRRGPDFLRPCAGGREESGPACRRSSVIAWIQDAECIHEQPVGNIEWLEPDW